MTLYICAHGAWYQKEIMELSKVFYPGYPVAEVEEKPALTAGDVFIDCTHGEASGGIVASVALTTENTTENPPLSTQNTTLSLYHTTVIEEREISIPAPAHTQAWKRAAKNHIKGLAYDLLSRVTGQVPPWGIVTGVRPVKLVHQRLRENPDISSIPAFLRDEYRMSPEKARLLTDIAQVQRPFLTEMGAGTASLYVHIPFCPTKCLYCSFPSDTVDNCRKMLPDYIDCLCRELDAVEGHLDRTGTKVQTIYVGGGTPTALPLPLLKRLMDRLGDIRKAHDCREFTVEAGRPDSIDREILSCLKEAGANRISINPQSMNAETLRRIGRSHTPEDVIEAYHLARETDFGWINMDLIVGLPGEGIDEMGHTLKAVREMDPDNLTIHTLAIKRSSLLKDTLDEHPLPGADTAIAMMDLCREAADEMGMHAYYLYRQKYMLGNLENVGYARPGTECAYNIQMMEEKQDTWAIGAGAITKLYMADRDLVIRVPNVKNLHYYIPKIDEMIGRKRKYME